MKPKKGRRKNEMIVDLSDGIQTQPPAWQSSALPTELSVS